MKDVPKLQVYPQSPFAHVISLSEFAGSLTEVNVWLKRAIRGDQVSYVNNH